MKRNRNSFFTETNIQGGIAPNVPPVGNVGYQAQNSYFYQGQLPQPNYNIQGNDIESRLAKIERQINRIDHRLNKLENNANIITTEDFESTSTNMYMV